MATGSGQIGLGPGGPHAPHGPDEGQPEVSRQIVSLIEAPFTPSRRMQGNRNDEVRAFEDGAGAVSHQRRERPRQRSASFVLERMHDRAERSIVRARGSGALDEPSESPATHTACAECIGRPPRG
jgi:hypothetical protein